MRRPTRCSHGSMKMSKSVVAGSQVSCQKHWTRQRRAALRVISWPDTEKTRLSLHAFLVIFLRGHGAVMKVTFIDICVMKPANGELMSMTQQYFAGLTAT